MRSRPCELGRIRLAVGALAFVWAAAPGLAQQTTADSLGLRGDDSLGLRGEDSPTLAMDAATPDAAAPVLAPPASSDLAPPVTGIAPPATDAGAPATTKKPPAKTKAPPLRLGVYQNAQRLGLRGGPPELADGQAPPPSVAALPPPAAPRRKPSIEDKPFDPVGIDAAGLKLPPYVEEDVGWSSDPGLTAGGQKGSAFETTEGGFALQSDWSRSDLHGSFKGGYNDYFAAPASNAPYGSGVLDGRLDVTRDLSFDA
ncbi:MAG: outer membrane beta-barrel protein, partial [Hyphomicrobiales bacterium]|nr:outer membrane beta-barrel protein [Hyphomicrobiales bacterium]